MRKVTERLGLKLANHYGLVERLDPKPDVVLLPHSMLRGGIGWPYRAIRLIRDPRDIWVSGYLYHLRCDEPWCRNSDLDPTPPIGWPRVNYSMIHWPEDWKRRYLERLGGRSYQRNLLDRSLTDGLDFELGGYTACTFKTMQEWARNGVNALDVRLEDVMMDFDGAMLRIFDYFGLTIKQSQAALEVARSEDIRRMDDAAILERPQISSRTISKWRDMLSTTQIACFEDSYGNLIRELGYEAAGAAADRPGDANVAPVDKARRAITDSDASGAVRSGQAELPEPCGGATDIVVTSQDAGVRLSADGAPICPTAVNHGTFTFVVPPGAERVRLVSRSGNLAGPHASDRTDNRCLGVSVTKIAIRSEAGDVVIAADHPGLTAGWHDAEQKGAAVWRWTDGSAEVPWTGISGPAVVTIHCTTLREYPIHDGRREN